MNPAIINPVLTDAQKAMQKMRLEAEEQMFRVQKMLWDAQRGCTEHVVQRGRTMFSPRQEKVVNTHDGRLPDDDCFSVCCAVCDKDLGWYCPVNPKGYCEYKKPENYGCDHCGAPDERK